MALRVRVPAAANGIYGFKPSSGVLPFIGYAASGYTGTNTGVPAVLGPMTNSLRDLSLLVSTLRAAEPWTYDPAVIPYILEQSSQLAAKGNSNSTTPRKPIIGIIHASGLTLHPPVKRGMLEAEAKLKAAGFEIIPFNPPSFTAIRDITAELFTLDGLSYARGQLEKAGEPVVESVRNIGFWSKPRKTMEEAWALNTRLGEVKKQMLDEWIRTKVDVVLCPAGPHTAVEPSKWSCEHYTVAWNAVDVSFSKLLW
jgi:amidase